MKRYLFILIGLILLLGACGSDVENSSGAEEQNESNNNNAKNEEQEEIEENDNDEQEEMSLEDEIEISINQIVEDDLDDTEITNIKINEDASTDEERYIILVDLRWDVKNKPDTTEEMIDMYSDHLAAKMVDYDKIYEFVEFWEIPYHKEDSSSIKKTYENVEEGMELKDEMKDPDIF